MTCHNDEGCHTLTKLYIFYLINHKYIQTKRQTTSETSKRREHESITVTVLLEKDSKLEVRQFKQTTTSA